MKSNIGASVSKLVCLEVMYQHKLLVLSNSMFLRVPEQVCLPNIFTLFLTVKLA